MSLMSLMHFLCRRFIIAGQPYQKLLDLRSVCVLILSTPAICNMLYIGFCCHCKSGYNLVKAVEKLLSIVEKEITPDERTTLQKQLNRLKGHMLYEVAPLVRQENHPLPLKYMLEDFGDTKYLSVTCYRVRISRESDSSQEGAVGLLPQ